MICQHVPWLYYAFYCNYETAMIYQLLVTTLGAASILIACQDKFREPKYRLLRGCKSITFIQLLYPVHCDLACSFAQHERGCIHRIKYSGALLQNKGTVLVPIFFLKKRYCFPKGSPRPLFWLPLFSQCRVYTLLLPHADWRAWVFAGHFVWWSWRLSSDIFKNHQSWPTDYGKPNI